jgi:hypothetical protein
VREWLKRNLKIKVQSEKLWNCFAETCFYHGLKILKLAGLGFGVDAVLIEKRKEGRVWGLGGSIIILPTLNFKLVANYIMQILNSFIGFIFPVFWKLIIYCQAMQVFVSPLKILSF